MRVLIVDDSRSSLALIGTIVQAATHADIDSSTILSRRSIEASPPNTIWFWLIM